MPSARCGAHPPVFALLLCVAFLTASCAKYAPQAPAAPLRQILEITLTTKSAPTTDYYYYIAFDTSGSTTTDGPHTTLSGAEAAKNWTYYIRIKDGVFTERGIATLSDTDAEPTPFNQSLRFYAASISGSAIVIRLYLDQLIAADTNIWFNFITSEAPLTSANINVPAVDYLTNPSFFISTANDINVTNDTYPAISGHAAPAGAEPADIIAWNVRIYRI